jgi:hypothetical protein
VRCLPDLAVGLGKSLIGAGKAIRERSETSEEGVKEEGESEWARRHREKEGRREEITEDAFETPRFTTQGACNVPLGVGWRASSFLDEQYRDDQGETARSDGLG